MRQSVLIHTQFPAPVRQAPAAIVPAAEQLPHHSRQQLRVALAVNTPVLLLTEHHALLKGYAPLCAVVAFPAQKFLFAPSCRKQIVVRRLGRVPRAYQVRQFHGVRFHLAPHVLYLVSHTALRRLRQHVAYLDVCLRRPLQLLVHNRYAALTVAARKKTVTLQPHPLPHARHNAAFLQRHIVRRAFVHAFVQTVLVHVFFHRRRILLLSYRVILVRHPHVPQYIGVPGFRLQHSARHLRVVIVWPYRYQLKLTRRTVIVHLKVVLPVLVVAQTGQLPRLERHTLHQVSYLIFVRVEVHPAVREVVYVEWLAVIALFRLLPHRAHLARAPRVYVLERRLLEVLHNAQLRVPFHIRHTARKQQSAAAVFLSVYVAAAAYWEQPREELHVVRRVTLYAQQAVVVAQRHLVAPLTAAHVHRHALYPPFSPGLIGYLLQSVVPVQTLRVVHHDVPRSLHLAHLPVRYAAHPAVQVLHHQGHMLTRRRRVAEYGRILSVQHQSLFDKARRTVQFHRVRPFPATRLLRSVRLHTPELPTFPHRPVVQLQCHALRAVQRHAQVVVTAHLLVVGAATVGHQRCPQPVPFVIYLQLHVL